MTTQDSFLSFNRRRGLLPSLLVLLLLSGGSAGLAAADLVKVSHPKSFAIPPGQGRFDRRPQAVPLAGGLENDAAGFTLSCCLGIWEYSGEAVVDVTIVGDLARTNTVSVDFSTRPVTATADVDYRSTQGTLQFVPGQSRQSIRIPLLNDDVVEAAEQFMVELRNPVGLPILDPTEVPVSIWDNETGYRVESGGDDGWIRVLEQEGDFKISVHRDGDFSLSSSVDVQVSLDGPEGELKGTAMPGLDFVPSLSTVTFGPGETDKFVRLHLLDDPQFDGPKSLWITLTNATSGVPISGGSQGVLIEDNEFNPARVDPDFISPFFYTRGDSDSLVPPHPNLQVMTDGRIVMATPLWRWNGNPGVGIVRLRSNGGIDPDFHLAKASSLNALAVEENGGILVAGRADFTLNGWVIPQLGRLHPDGTLDTNFVARLGESNAPVVSLLPLSGGGCLVATDESKVYRLLAGGGVDPGFRSISLAGGVRTLAVDSAKRVLIFGDIVGVDGQNRPGLARLMPDGSLDGSFLASWDQGYIENFNLQPDDSILVGLTDEQGWHLLRLKPDGTQDGTFKAIDQLVPVDSLDFVAMTARQQILISWATPDGTHRLSRWNSSGNPDSDFTPTTYRLGWWMEHRDPTFSVLPEANGNLLIQGDISLVNGCHRPGIARLLLNEPLPRLELSAESAEVFETNGIVRLKLLRSGDNHAPLTIDWLTEGGTAVPGSDYFPAQGTVIFGANESEQFVEIRLIDNLRVDADRTLVLQLTAGGMGPLPRVVCTILNDDVGIRTEGTVRLPNGGFLLNLIGNTGRPGLRFQRSKDLRQWTDWTEWFSAGFYSPVLDSDAESNYQYYRVLDQSATETAPASARLAR